MEKEVDGIFQFGRNTPVALRGQEHEGIVAGDLAGPNAGVFMLVVLGVLDTIGDTGFVKNGEVEDFEVDQVDGGSCSEGCIGRGVGGSFWTA